MLIDKCTLFLRAGNGGNGVISWRKEAHYPKGGPWGGDGGKGGDVYIIGDHNLNSLIDLRYKKKIEAEDGENGKTKLATGKNGNDIYIKVPVGTTITNSITNEVIVDILVTGQKYLICKGGMGGKGNAYFKSSKNRIPNLCENGELGETIEAQFELKYIADVGLLGLPNAGKSTLVNSLSNTNLKTANYMFTTLSPSLGVVNFEDEHLVFADIPGIIEDASNGSGLGLDFLKHIERCHFLIHLISVANIDTENPFKDYLTIVEELKKYNKEILKRKIFIVLNKIDENDSKDNINLFLKEFKKISNKKVYQISGFFKENTNELLKDIFKDYKKHKEQWERELEEKINSYSLVKVEKEQEDIVTYEKDENRIWVVSSKRIAYWFNRIPFNTDENVTRFMQKIKMDEIEQTLKDKGAKIGDSFRIQDVMFEIN
ncbi:GTPase ObgE [Malacoplasma penetrans]|uniref:GTPase ObgE n=1 Tax=Malacoplasma penetrans TaxID=28227 RepID=UPI0010134047|nr:GTPase ObgE [Malacoplasma penetrans]RXY96337.1 GTPase ObgE [Malacoplasma penetrans]